MFEKYCNIMHYPPSNTTLHRLKKLKTTERNNYKGKYISKIENDYAHMMPFNTDIKHTQNNLACVVIKKT